MAWMRAPLLLALGLGNAEYLRTLQEVNLVPEDEAADLKKQEEAQREKAMAEAAAAMEKAKAMLAEAEKAKAAVLGALPDHSQFSVPNLVCAGVKPKRTAVCVGGAARTFGHPVVYRTLKTNVIDALGGIRGPIRLPQDSGTTSGTIRDGGQCVTNCRLAANVTATREEVDEGIRHLQISTDNVIIKDTAGGVVDLRRAARIMAIFA